MEDDAVQLLVQDGQNHCIQEFGHEYLRLCGSETLTFFGCIRYRLTMHDCSVFS